MTNTEAIETLRVNYPDACYEQLREAVDAAIEALKAQDVPDTNVGDIISRQAAIDVLDEFQESVENGTPCYAKARVEMCNIPSAQPKQEIEFVRLMVRNDLNGRPYYSIIYRELDDDSSGLEVEGYVSYSLDVISDDLKKYFMPPAQPEIIHCWECKHRPTLDENGKPDFPTYRCPCRCDDYYYSWTPKDDWFCGNAERREK